MANSKSKVKRGGVKTGKPAKKAARKISPAPKIADQLTAVHEHLNDIHHTMLGGEKRMREMVREELESAKNNGAFLQGVFGGLKEELAAINRQLATAHDFLMRELPDSLTAALKGQSAPSQPESGHGLGGSNSDREPPHESAQKLGDDLRV